MGHNVHYEVVSAEDYELIREGKTLGGINPVLKQYGQACFSTMRYAQDNYDLEDSVTIYWPQIDNCGKGLKNTGKELGAKAVRYFEMLLSIPAIRNCVLNADSPIEDMLSYEIGNYNHGVHVRNDIPSDWWLNVMSFFRYIDEYVSYDGTVVHGILEYDKEGYPPLVSLLLGSCWQHPSGEGNNNLFGSGHQQIGQQYIDADVLPEMYRTLMDAAVDVTKLGKQKRIDTHGYQNAQGFWAGFFKGKEKQGNWHTPKGDTLDTKYLAEVFGIEQGIAA